jgi:peptidoglycan hydrolase-like protein with peptidoglycan-binding domain
MKSKLDLIKAENPVLELQFYLKDIAKCNPAIPRVVPTGSYDPQTEKAVIEFQRTYNLSVTGKVDHATWNAIRKEYMECTHNTNKPSTVCCFPDQVSEYKLGDECSLIYILQIILKNYQKKFKNYSDIDITGKYDEKTEAAVKQFQKCTKLPVTGILDRKTWNMLNKINETCKLYND